MEKPIWADALVSVAVVSLAGFITGLYSAIFDTDAERARDYMTLGAVIFLGLRLGAFGRKRSQ